MKQTTLVYGRLSYTYNLAYAHLDESVCLGEIRMTSPQQVESQDDDGGITFATQVEASPSNLAIAKAAYRAAKPEGVTFSNWYGRAIAETLSYSCGCEHDCCGHSQTSASVTKLSPRRFSVTLRSYINC